MISIIPFPKSFKNLDFLSRALFKVVFVKETDSLLYFGSWIFSKYIFYLLQLFFFEIRGEILLLVNNISLKIYGL